MKPIVSSVRVRFPVLSSIMKEPSLEEVFLNLTGEKMKAD